jgi:hypothetical protein
MSIDPLKWEILSSDPTGDGSRLGGVMRQASRSLAMVGAIALASLSAGSAGAQSIGWNLIQPTACYEFAGLTNGQTLSTVWVYTSTYTVHITNPAAATAALQWCYDRSAFWAYYNGGTTWTLFWVTPGLK